jgi:hypothetical protein
MTSAIDDHPSWDIKASSNRPSRTNPRSVLQRYIRKSMVRRGGNGVFVKGQIEMTEGEFWLQPLERFRPCARPGVDTSHSDGVYSRAKVNPQFTFGREE